MDYLSLFRLIPLILTVILLTVFLFFLASIVLSRTRPPTDEPVIGKWSFILKGTGGTVEGITTTARGAADSTVISRLKEFGALDDVVKDLHLYAVRDGRDRVLIVSDVGIEGNEYSEKEGRNRWVFPFGPTAYRRIIGYGVDVSKETSPEFFRQHEPAWDRCVVIWPDNIEIGKPRDPKLPEQARNLAETLMLLKEVSLDVAGIKARDEKLGIQDRALKRLGDQVLEELDRRILAQEDAYASSEFAQPGEVPERRSPLPRMSRGRFVTICLSAAAGYWYLPQYTRFLPNSSALLGAGAMWAFWLVWDNWLTEWF